MFCVYTEVMVQDDTVTIDRVPTEIQKYNSMIFP